MLIRATVVFMVCLPMFSVSAAHAEPDTEIKVSSIEVDLSVSGKDLPPEMREKISHSVLRVGEKALAGKTLEEAEALRNSLSQVMRKIFSEVLSGFRIIELSMVPGETTTISLVIEAEGPEVESVKVEVSLQEGIHHDWKKLVIEKLEDFEKTISGNLQAIPVNSARWSTDLIKESIEESLDPGEKFPGFETEIDVEIDTNAVVEISLKPSSPTIKVVFAKMRSQTIPAVLMERIKFDFAREVELLIGVPVEFAAANENYITEKYMAFLEAHSYSRMLALEFSMRMSFSERMVVSVMAESEKYSGFARVKISLGKTGRNPDAEGHLGIFPIKDTEVFSEFNFMPGPIDLQLNFGVGRRFKNLYVAGGRNILDGLDRVWVNYQITEDFMISGEKNVVDNHDERFEGSITFKAHDFFSIEVVADFQTDVWLRFIANL